MQDAQRGKFDIVLAEALDRVSRDQADVATLFKHLRFAGVQIVTLAEGEISELHVGLKGTMNALFLKDLAAKTHRGLRGRVEKGKAGGGLIAGIAAWFGGRVRMVGVEPEAAPTLTMALEAGGPVDAPAGGIAADSLAPRRIGTLVYPIATRLLDRVVLVSDDAIVQAQQVLWERLRVVAEPGGAAAFAALVSGRYKPRHGEHIGILLSGGNTVAVDFGS